MGEAAATLKDRSVSEVEATGERRRDRAVKGVSAEETGRTLADRDLRETILVGIREVHDVYPEKWTPSSSGVYAPFGIVGSRDLCLGGAAMPHLD